MYDIEFTDEEKEVEGNIKKLWDDLFYNAKVLLPSILIHFLAMQILISCMCVLYRSLM